MKIIKKSVIILFFVILLLLLSNFIVNVNAADVNMIQSNTPIGSEFTMSAGQWQYYLGVNEFKRVFCVQHDKDIDLNVGSKMTYVLKEHLVIVGNKATKSDGTTMINEEYARIAYWANRQINGSYLYDLEGVSKDPNHILSPKHHTLLQNIIFKTNTFFGMCEYLLGLKGFARLTDLQKNPLYVTDASIDYLIQEGNNYYNTLYRTDWEVNKTITANATNVTTNVAQYPDGKNYIEIGPFNWSFEGTINSINIKDTGGNTVSSYRVVTNYNTNKSAQSIGNVNDPTSITSGKNFYLIIDSALNLQGISKITANGRYGINVSLKQVEIWFLQEKTHTWQNMIYLRPLGEKQAGGSVSGEFTYNITFYGHLEVLKKDLNTGAALKDFGFKIYNTSKKQYITAVNSVRYGNSENAMVFKTDSNGKFTIKNLEQDSYQAIEVSVGDNVHYAVPSGEDAKTNFTIVAGKTQQCTIYNTQKYIEVSGYVWIDNPYADGKELKRNDLYKDGTIDNNDILVDDVKVELKEISTGKVIETTSTKGGNYELKKVEIDALSNLMVEFTYDGLIYQNVVAHNSALNGSKAVEPGRQNFNNNFAYVEKGATENQAGIKDSDGNTIASVEYSFKQQANGREASISQVNNGNIIANTNTAGYTLSYNRESGSGKITNVNLGIYERKQADLALRDELEQVKIEVAGYGHLYNYGPSYNTSDSTEEENSWNLGLRFENTYKKIYKRPIYKADAQYEAEASEMLKMYLTYKITFSNQEQLTSKVNKIVDYYDSRYELIGIGKGMDDKGNLTQVFGQERYRNQPCDVDGYTKIEINTEELLKSQVANTSGDKITQSSIYIQFNLPREIILEMLNNNNREIYEDDLQLEEKLQELENQGKTLRNTSEISSFTTYSEAEGKVLYAAMDKDSIPGNATVGNEQTYEDDTDKASSLALILANARLVSGMIFEDLENENLINEKNISEGDSIYNEEKENKIGGFKVELVEVDESGNIKKEIDEEGNEKDKVAKIFDEQAINADGSLGKWVESEVNTVSDSDGAYKISGFIPGRYVIKFTWGDGSYKIIEGKQTPDEEDYYKSMPENYKSTVIDYDRYQKEFINSKNKFYREVNTSPIHSSHAIDNLETRKSIDDEFKDYDYKSETSIREMTSTTPILEINVEYNDNDIISVSNENSENRIYFEISKIDFGIIKRPIQKLNMVKSLSGIKFTLPNGQVLIDAYIDENHNISGQKPYLTYLPPTKNKQGITTENGLLKIEIDNDLIQGSTIDMKYRLKVENLSQADYIDSTYGYYKNGESYYQEAPVGERQKDTDIITISPAMIIDYLDETLVYQPDDNTNQKYKWRQLTLNQLKTEELVATNIREALEKGKYEIINENGDIEIIEDKSLNQSQILATDYLKDTALKPVFTIGDTLYQAQSGEVYLVASNVLSTSDEATYQNQEIDDAVSEQTTVIPSTGSNKAYILPVTVLIICFILLGVGIYLIVVKVIKRDFK